MKNYFQGKRVLVTGASSGIGFALAERLVRMNANMILVARNEAKLIRAQQKLLAGSNQECSVLICPVDISDRAGVEQTLGKMLQGHPPDILINNAGIPSCDLFENIEEDEFVNVMNVNFFGQVWVTKLVLPMMKERGSGVIVNLSSMGGIIGIAGYTAYSASKFALVGFTECLRNELAGTGIAVVSVLPSDVATPLFDMEDETRPAANRAIGGNAKPMTSEYVADQTIKGIAKRKQEVVISPFSGRMLVVMHRIFPSAIRWLLDSIAKKHNRAERNE